MKYLCLRNCFVGGVYYAQGQTYELEEEQVNSPKNFKFISESGKAESGEEEPAKSQGAKTETGVKPDVIPAGMYWCFKDKVLHRENSKLGKRHLKYREVQSADSD